MIWQGITQRRLFSKYCPTVPPPFQKIFMPIQEIYKTNRKCFPDHVIGFEIIIMNQAMIQCPKMFGFCITLFLILLPALAVCLTEVPDTLLITL